MNGGTLAGLARAHGALLALLAGLTVFQVWGIDKIPFHPDEATQLYMSGDWETLWTDPLAMAFDPAREDDPRQRYRALDAPLTRYLLGVGRQAFGLDALPVDWDWGQTWEENAAAGALPSPELLRAGRLAVTVLLPWSGLLAYLAGARLGGRLSGWAAALALGLHALTLLHGRRAMAEGALVFGVLFAVWSFLQADRRPWLAGLGMALAFNAKQSALALLPAGVLAAVWISGEGAVKFRRAGVNLVQFLVVFGLATGALNPLYWRHPAQALWVSVEARQDLLARQVGDARALAPAQVLDAPVQRAAVMVGHLFVLPLQFFEVGNYQAETAASVQAYLEVPGHALMRGLGGGGVLMALMLAGMAQASLALRRKEARPAAVLLLATGLMAGGLLAAVPLPFQRYWMPLVPLAALWIGVGMGWVSRGIRAVYAGWKGGGGG